MTTAEPEVAARILREVSRVTITLVLDRAPAVLMTRPNRGTLDVAPVQEAVAPSRAEVVLTSIDQGSTWAVAGLSLSREGGYGRFYRANPTDRTWADDTPAWVRRLGELCRADDGGVESAPAYCADCGYAVELRGLGVPGDGPWAHVEAAGRQGHPPRVEEDDPGAARYAYRTVGEG